ncbi:MAG: adenosylmethionine decarboxylase [Fusobacterium sp.]|nr:adenosylmethionine decarboxylase [Fusobacterium sp.]
MDVRQPLQAFEQEGVEEVNLGQHVLAEFFECDPNTLNSIDKVEKYMVDAALECGATIVQKCFHMFNPYGVSGVVIISESHLAIHTWPELGYAAVDLFTCGDKCDPKVSYEFLKKKFHCQNATFTELKRGILNKNTMKVSEKPFEIAEQICG